MIADTIPVVIVGAGPTGITAATLLARYGVESLVLERWESVYPQPRAVHVDGEVRRILADVGIEDEFAKITVPMALARFVDRKMKVLADFHRRPAGRHGYPEANMLDQPEFEALLRANAAQYTWTSIRSNVEVERLEHDDGSIVVHYLDHATGTREFVRARYVLGCDGANSVVRTAIGATMQDLHFEQRWLVVDVATQEPLPAQGVGVCDPAGACIYVKNGNGRYRWEFRLDDDQSAADFQDLEQLAPLIEPWTGGIDLDKLELVRVAEYTFRAQIADRWRKRRVFILGDAAHLTPPFIGQGMCAGIRDSSNLAWKLAGVIHGDLPEQVLDTYELERKPHARTMIRLAKLLGRALTDGGDLGNLLRRLIMPQLHRVPGLEQMITSGDTPRLRRSELIIRAPILNPLAGTLAPNALVVADRRLDDLTAGRFAVVTREAPSTDQALTIDCRGAVLVQVEPSSALERWLSKGKANAVLVRPDGTVARASKDLRNVIAALPKFRGFQNAHSDLPSPTAVEQIRSTSNKSHPRRNS